MEDETGGDKLQKSFVRCKGIQESLGFWIPHRGFWIQGTGFRILCHWNVDSGFQSVVGFRILELNSEFQFSKSRIPDCASKKSWIPNSSSKKIHELRNPEFFSWGEIVRKNHRLKSFRLKEFVVVLKHLRGAEGLAKFVRCIEVSLYQVLFYIFYYYWVEESVCYTEDIVM